jgi:hypothetical protein
MSVLAAAPSIDQGVLVNAAEPLPNLSFLI